MKRIVKFLNYFPNVKGRVWVDMYSLVALIRFAMGHPVDSTTLAVVLGAYVINKGTNAVATKLSDVQ